MSNFIYWKEVNYFSNEANTNWLLHTWSLSVEWQFYLLFPIVIVMIKSIKNNNLILPIVTIITLLSLIISIYLSHRSPAFSYYLLPTRAWELLFGSIAFLHKKNIRSIIINKIVYCFGFVLILFSFFIFDKQTAWPGYSALLPVTGTFLVIKSNIQKGLIQSSYLFQKLGAWSYSIYLWHWPILVFLYYFGFTNISLVGIPLSIFAGFISYTYVEKLFSKKNIITKVKITYMYLITLCLFTLVNKINYDTFLVNSADESVKTIVQSLHKKIIFPSGTGVCFTDLTNNNRPISVTENPIKCNLGNVNSFNDKKILFFGSSYMAMYEPFLSSLLTNFGVKSDSVSSNWCEPTFNDVFLGNSNSKPFFQCENNRKWLKRQILSKNYDVIFLAGQWGAYKKNDYLNGVHEVIDLAALNNIKVIILPNPIEYVTNPINYYYRTLYRGDTVNISFLEKNDLFVEKGNDDLKSFSEKNENVFFIEKNCLFSNDGLFTINDVPVPYTFDGHHISKLASLHLIDDFINTSCFRMVHSVIFNKEYVK